MRWEGKIKTGRAEGRSKREEVEVSSKERHVPDHLSRRKDITLFASIVPLCAETINLSLPSIAGLHLENTHLTVMEANERTRTCYQTKTSKFTDLPQHRVLLLQPEGSLLDVDE